MTTSPEAAASVTVPARAFSPRSETSSCSVSGPRELLITTSYPRSTRPRARVDPMCPAPMIPTRVMPGATHRESADSRCGGSESRPRLGQDAPEDLLDLIELGGADRQRRCE